MKYSYLVVTEQQILWMRAPAVNNTRQNYGTTTEKLAIECDNKYGATTNLHQ